MQSLTGSNQDNDINKKSKKINFYRTGSRELRYYTLASSKHISQWLTYKTENINTWKTISLIVVDTTNTFDSLFCMYFQ